MHLFFGYLTICIQIHLYFICFIFFFFIVMNRITQMLIIRMRILYGQVVVYINGQVVVLISGQVTIYINGQVTTCPYGNGSKTTYSILNTNGNEIQIILRIIKSFLSISFPIFSFHSIIIFSDGTGIVHVRTNVMYGQVATCPYAISLIKTLKIKSLPNQI